jgi:transcriptional regulator
MDPEKPELLQGTLDLLVLRALSTEERHGLGISRRIGEVTRGALDVKPGSLFPALYRLEQEGAVSSFWGRSANNRRAKYYRLTAAGRRRLAAETRQWNRISAAIRLALETG